MPRNGNGTFSFGASSWNPAINGNAATAPDWNALRTDISNGLTQSVSRDGQSPMTGNLPMGGNRITNLGQASDDNDALRRAQIIKGTDIASAAALAVPIEGSLFDVTGTTAITSISDVYPGRVVILRFMDSLTLTNSANLILPTGSNISTNAGDIATFVNTEFGIWACLNYQTYSTDFQVWGSQPLGVPFPVMYEAVEPPNDSPSYRYIKLTINDDYNDGVLISQTQTGTFPEIEATAVISLEASPLNGETVILSNTEQTFFRPGVSGFRQGFLNASHTHTGTTVSAGAHIHTFQVGSILVPGAGGLEGGSGREYVNSTANTGSSGAHTHTFTTNANGGVETRPRNVGATYYMRIL